MVNSVFHLDALSLREPVSTSLENASREHARRLAPPRKPCQCIARRIVPEKCDLISGNFGQFSGPTIRRWNSFKPQASPIREPRAKLRCRSSNRHFQHRCRGDVSMTLTLAHISPIISVIAGVLILIMPRLLNLIVAIFLIVNGLIGLGLLRWLHM
jgi:Protein of unknown function (DUF3096)